MTFYHPPGKNVRTPVGVGHRVAAIRVRWLSCENSPENIFPTGPGPATPRLLASLLNAILPLLNRTIKSFVVLH